MFFNKVKKNIYIIFINLLILFLLLYLVELFFQIKKKTFLTDNKFTYRQKLIKQGETEVNLAFAPYKLLELNGINMLPLSGISNTETILCKDNNEFYKYKSDKFGFNNDKIIDSDLLVVGDSYVHGLCLKQKNNLTNQLNRLGFKTNNLGIMANGPLLEYATFREYSRHYKFKTLVWLFNPDNDFKDFNNEIKNVILLKYLKDIKFTQNLAMNNDLKDEIIQNYFNYNDRKIKEFTKHYHLDLKFIRDTIQSYIDKKNLKKNKPKKEIFGKIDKNLEIIFNILLNTNFELKKDDKNFIIIFNSLAPYYLFPDSKDMENKKKLLLQKTEIIKKKLLLNNIPFYDFNEFVKEKYDKKSIDKIYKKTSKGYDHFTKEGNELLAQNIKDNINKIYKHE